MFFFPYIYMKRWKEEGGKGYIGFFWKCFFHCGEGREGKVVIFFTNSLWDGGKGAP